MDPGRFWANSIVWVANFANLLCLVTGTDPSVDSKGPGPPCLASIALCILLLDIHFYMCMCIGPPVDKCSI
ncbi:hypothetical protein CsSME_00008951 [Camellia sinensis var. sinensis]